MNCIKNCTIKGAAFYKVKSWKRVKSFIHFETDGGITIPALMVFSVSFALMGFAFDIALFEAKRVALQTQLDNATLSAASLRETREPRKVIEDYIDLKNSAKLSQLEVFNDQLTQSQRSIRSRASGEVDTVFMKFFGVSKLKFEVSAKAEEYAPNLEISLVLDISESMEGEKLVSLKLAAKEFVSTLLSLNSNEFPNQVSISLVPYNMQVNVGEKLLTSFKEVNLKHDHGFCVDWQPNAFKTLEVNPYEMEQKIQFGVSNFDDYGNLNWNGIYNLGYIDNPACNTEPFSMIIPLSKDEQILHDQIDAFEANSSTSIGIGMKWGAALLDPSIRPAIQNLAKDSVVGLKKSLQDVDIGFSERPADYSDNQTMKVIVLMTDGAVTAEKFMKPPFNTTLESNVWRNSKNVNNDPNSSVNENGPLHSTIRFNLSNEQQSNLIGWKRLSWAEMWGYVSIDAYIQHDTLKNHSRRDFEGTTTEYSKVSELQSICTAIKTKSNENDSSNPIQVFSIFYGDPTSVGGTVIRGQEQMKYCASAKMNYFVADEVTISDTFNEISGIVGKLQLVK